MPLPCVCQCKVRVTLVLLFSLALPCHEPYCPYTAYTAYIYPTPVRLAVFCTFFAFCPADPVGYLSHVLRLHRERELLDKVLLFLYLCTCIYFYIYISLYRFCV